MRLHRLLPSRLKVRIVSISLIHEDFFWVGPGNVESRIVPTHAACMLGGISREHLIGDLGVVGQRLKAVRTFCRHIEHRAIILSQFHGYPFLERRRCWSQVDDRIIDRTSGTAHNFGLTMRGDLIVHSADRTLPNVEGTIALDHLRLQTARRKLSPGPGPGKKSALILKPIRLDDEYSGKFCFSKDHPFNSHLRRLDSNDLYLWNWNNKAPTAATIFSLLFQHFVGEVPRQ